MEQTFNTVVPPAGEAGMCVMRTEVGRDCYRRWDGDAFYAGFYCDAAQSVWRALRSPVSIGLSIRSAGWRWATLDELTDAGIPESEARMMVHRSQLDAAAVGAPSTGHAIQPPNATRHHTPKPIPADYIPWHGQGVPNLPAGTRIKYLTRSGAEAECAVHGVSSWSHDGGPMDVIAYRPVNDGDARMLIADTAEHKPRPVAMRSMSHDEIKNLGRALARQWTDRAVSESAWVEHPHDHRLGNFN